MKKHYSKSTRNLAVVLTALIAIVFSFSLKAQPCNSLPCPESPLSVVPNPEFPGCKALSDGPFKILVVLDESGSITPSLASVRAAVKGFAMELRNLTDAPGKVEMGLIEFSAVASNALLPNVLIDVKGDPNFLTKVSNYLDVGYVPASSDPAACTNFEAALNAATIFPRVDMIFFITDGKPTFGNIDPTVWSLLANNLKSPPRSTYIFAIGVGSGICENHLQDLSGPRKYPDNAFSNADWTLNDFSSLGDDLILLAQSLFDTEAPTITCSGPIKTTNDPGRCGKSLAYPAPTVSDECPPVTTVCVPPSGSFFNVGSTTVTCTAKDKVGNIANCSFKVTVLDLEAPKITCPANKLISCEESTAPTNTGSPITSDNCGVGSVSHTDLRVDGSCPNEFTINRTWTVVDIHGNANNCLQVISVEDKKKPVIKCPTNITVTCDISIPKTGTATATDNCDASVSITHQDIPISGDCDWFCITERHWTATDDCGNFSKCVQVITKDVTPLIEKALEGGPLVWGQTAATVTLPPGKGACVVKWLPYVGVVPTALKFDDAVAGASCTLMTNPLDRNTGQIVNPLLGEALKLKILVRLNPALGTRKVKQILDSHAPPCDMHFIVRQALGGGENATVNELLRVTDLTLGNVNVNLLVPEHALHLLAVLKCINDGRSVCNNP